MPVRDMSEHARHPLSAVDAAFGRSVDAAMQAKHRVRLRRHGWEWVLHGFADTATPESWWVPGIPVREGNQVEVLVDGALIAPRIAELVDGARHHVHLTAWHASPDFEMSGDGTRSLRDVLADAAERVPVRLLMWAGAPLPVFPPSAQDVLGDGSCREQGTRIDVALDRRERPMHCHHEKIVVVDDEVAVLGGLDLTHLQGNRFDHREHDKSAELGWHDVVMVVRGPVVADIARHVTDRWREVTGVQLPEAVPQPAAGTVALQLLRTIPNDVYDFAPDGEFANLAAYIAALRGAEHLIYLENQFLWSPEVVDVLLDKLQRPPTPEFRMLLVLPRRPSNGSDTTNGQLGRLIAADGGRGHLLATTLLGPTADSKGVYVHAKVGIVDDRWLTIGSANLNEHSLYNDTEANLLTLDEELARDTRLRLWSEHLRVPVEQVSGDPTTVIDTLWTAQCDEQDEVSRRHLDPVHRVRRLAGLSSRVDRLRGPLMGLFVDG